MEWYVDRSGSQIYFSIYQSELQYMVGNAVDWTDNETGGDLIGLWTHAGRPVISLATPPGSNAIHQPAHFRQDVDFFNRNAVMLPAVYGVQPIGSWHSHPPGFQNPSMGDNRHTQSVASKNNIPRMVQIIVIPQSGLGATGNPAHRQMERGDASEDVIASAENGEKTNPMLDKRKQPGLGGVASAKVNAFFYGTARRGEYIPCPIRVIPGMSPIRTAGVAQDLQFASECFPFDKIEFNEISPFDTASVGRLQYPASLRDQLGKLPGHILQEIEATKDGGVIFLSVKKPFGRIIMTLDERAPHSISTVHVAYLGTDALIDLTDEVESGDSLLSLFDVLEMVEPMVREKRKKLAARQEDSSEAPLSQPIKGKGRRKSRKNRKTINRRSKKGKHVVKRPKKTPRC